MNNKCERVMHHACVGRRQLCHWPRRKTNPRATKTTDSEFGLCVRLQLLNKGLKGLQFLLVNKLELEDEKDKVLEAGVEVSLCT